MHEQAMQWVRDHAPAGPVHVLDLGGRNINGTARDAFPEAASWTALDRYPADGVDIVADAAAWVPGRQWDVVVSTEVFEHTADWRAILHTAHAALRPGGLLILTMAGPGRPEHSGIDGGSIRPGEWYRNVDKADLHPALLAAGFVDVVTDWIVHPGDTRAVARKPNTVTEETPS